jgi:hypothetical protein
MHSPGALASVVEKLTVQIVPAVAADPTTVISPRVLLFVYPAAVAHEVTPEPAV